MKNDTSDSESVDSWSIMGYEVPALSEAFRCMHSSIGANLETPVQATHICVTLTASPLKEEQRPAVDVMVALDVSGSMRGAKLALCQRTLGQLLRLLSSDDRFGLVTYATSSRLEVPLRKMTAENKTAALVKIQALRSRDATNISSAIGLSFQELRAIGTPSTVQTVFLLTDGQSNQGIQGISELETFTKNCAVGGAVRINRDGFEAPIQPSLSPISMYCFGYGDDHDGNLLSKISAAASGSYYYIEDDSGVDGAFGDALGGVMSMVVQNAVVTLQLDPLARAQGASIVKIHHDQVVERENGSFSVNVGDLYAEEVRDIIVELQLEAISQPQVSPIPHLIASVGYSDVSQKILVQGKEHTVSIHRPEGAECSLPDHYITEQLIRLSTAEALDLAQAMADRGDLHGAKKRIREAHRCVQESTMYSHQTPMAMQLGADLTAVSAALDSKSVYERKGSKLLAKQRRTHREQRCSEVSFKDQAFNIYATSSKMSSMNLMNEKS